MGYFIAILMFLGGFPFIFTARKSANNVKDIRKLLEDDKNRQEAKGSLQVIEIRSSRHSFECDVKLVFTNHNGKIFRYEESFSGFDSKASFLWKCENKGEVPITIIYDKSFPSKHFIRELKPLEVNENSKIGYAVIGILFMLLGIFIANTEFFLNRL